MTKLYVSNKDQSVRMFRSGFLEKLSHVHPAVPHVIFLPVIGYMLYLGHQAQMGLGRGALLFLSGLVAWTLSEYLLHRFVFHVSPEVEKETHRIVSRLGPNEAVIPALTSWRQIRYFVAHGVHHDFPNDSTRLVMPPGVSIPLAFLFYYAFRLAVGATYVPSLFAGFVVGYLIYDTTHHAVHHFRLRSKLGQYLKKHHFRHHYQDAGKNFGVSSPLWDGCIGTVGRPEQVDGIEALRGVIKAGTRRK